MNIQQYRISLVTWTILIIIGLSIPGSSLPQLNIIGIDKVAHVFLFLVWMFLALKSIKNITKRNILVICITGLTFATVSEFYQQAFIANRLADAWDAVANILGLIFGFALKRESTNVK